MSERSFKNYFLLQKPVVGPMEDAGGVIIILDLVLQIDNHKRNQVFFLCICIKNKKAVTPNWKILSKFYFLIHSFCTPAGPCPSVVKWPSWNDPKWNFRPPFQHSYYPKRSWPCGQLGRIQSPCSFVTEERLVLVGWKGCQVKNIKKKLY